MNALIQTYPLPFALILALLAALIVLLAVNARLRKMQRALRGRIIESERTITAQQTQLNETVNSVLQMSVSSAQSSEARTQQLADRLEARLSGIAESNERRLDDMRRLIDEQLSGTLEKRLGQSFQQVSRQLEQVYKGLGEMQTLAGGVGDLKKVLTGVKTRGVWGEIQLGRLLGDTLTEGQYLENTPVVPGSSERVEFAVRLPGRVCRERMSMRSGCPLTANSRSTRSVTSSTRARQAIRRAPTRPLCCSSAPCSIRRRRSAKSTSSRRIRPTSR